MKEAKVFSRLHSAQDAVPEGTKASDIYLRPGYTALEAGWLDGKAMAIAIELDGTDIWVPLIERHTPAGNTDWTSPYGYPWNGPALVTAEGSVVLREIALLADNEGVSSVFLRSSPRPSGPQRIETSAMPVGSGSYSVRLVNNTHSISLGQPDILARYSSGIRRDVRRAMREPLVASIQTEWDPETILGLYIDSLNRLEASSYHYFSARYLSALQEIGGNDQFLSIVRDDSGALLSFGLFFSASPVAQYHISAGDSKHKLRGYATKLMIHTAAMECQARDCSELHLGGAPTSTTGLDDLKRRFGTQTNDYFVAEIIPNSTRYEAELQACEAEVSDVRFPRYRGGE